jgi:outer membrane autotransporter protein
MCAELSELASVFRGRGPLVRGVSAILGGSVAAATALLAVPQVRAQFVTNLPNPERQNAAQFDMAVAIDTMCPNPAFRSSPDPETERLNDTCDAIAFTLPNNEQRDSVLQTLNGEEVQAAQQQVGEISDAQIDNISTRLSAVRAGTAGAGLSFAGLSILNGDRLLALDDPQDLKIMPAQFEESDFLSRLGIFATGELTFGDKDRSGEIDGYDFDTQGLTIGADWPFTDELVGGAAVGYSRFNADFDESADSLNGQELDSDAVQFSLFGSYYPTDQLFVDGIASFGWHFYDSERRILVPSAPDPTTLIETKAKGDLDAIHYGVATNVGYTIRRFGANLTPIARLEYLRAEIDGFTEDSPEAIELTFDDHDADSFTLNLGLEADYPISTGFGIIAPNIRAEYVHDFVGDADGVLVRYAADPTQLSEFEASTEDKDQDYGILGAGAALTLQGGWAAFVDYHTFVGLDNFDIHTVNAGLRLQF